MEKKPSLMLRLFGLVLILAGSLGILLFCVSAWFGITDPEEMELSVRIGAVVVLLFLAGACFGVVLLGRKCMKGPKIKTAVQAPSYRSSSALKQRQRCPECGATVQGESGKKVKCPYCQTKVSL